VDLLKERIRGVFLNREQLLYEQYGEKYASEKKFEDCLVSLEFTDEEKTKAT
jgi:hypothetical protein